MRPCVRPAETPLLPAVPCRTAALSCSVAAAGLTTLYRDKAFLAMDEEQRAKRMLVLSKTLGSAWIKTEAQAIIDRAKVARIRPPGGENAFCTAELILG